MSLTEEAVDEEPEVIFSHIGEILDRITSPPSAWPVAGPTQIICFEDEAGILHYDQPMVVVDEEWKDRAACKGKTALFYPKDIDGTNRARTDGYREGRRICQGCPVRRECTEAGKSERHGLWGGMSENERHPKMRRLGA
jgi:hypothetical protein